MRTVRVALVASCTMACLAELRYATVITDEEGAASFAIVLIPAAFGYIALVDAAVVMQQNGGNVQSVGTRHAIFAVVARDDRIGKHYLRRIFQQSQFFFRARVEGRIGAEIVLQMFHIRHAAQYRQYFGEAPGKAECPGSYTLLRAMLFQACHQVVVQSG